MRDHKGNTALHYAAMFRDFSSIRLLVEAMENAGAEINTLSDYLGSPVNRSVLDSLDLTKDVPSSIVDKGEAAIEEWNQRTAEIQTFLEQHGARHRRELLEERWVEFSFFEKQKAKLLSSQMLAPVARLTEIFDLWRSLGPDVKTTRKRLEQERNPEETI
jgi:hypothetical protein